MIAALGSVVAVGGILLGLWIIRRTERWLAKQEASRSAR
jgi:hypothetical protein